MASIAFITGAYAQNVNIPDANFKAALVANASINTNMDTEIQVIEASVFNGAINVSQLNITDLTGIEEFVALDYLDCRGNYISGLDVSANIALTYLDCSGNYLPGYGGFNGGNDYVYYLDTLDVSANIAITILKCNNNGLLSLNTTGLTALTYIDCSFNSRLYFAPMWAAPVLYHSSSPLLNFSSNTALTYLNCSSNALSSLDVSENTALTYLDCSNYNWTEDEIMVEDGVTLSSLNLSANTALTYLNCIGNVLSSLDLSTCNELTFLDCSYNQLTSLDVSACTALTILYCFDNNLTSLNVNNGYNINMFDFQGMDGENYPAFLAYNNPNLSCIEVDNVAWSNANWANNIDATASFSENCSAVGILDNDESTAILAYPNPTTGTIYLSNSANITLTDLSGKLLLEEENTNQLDISSLPAGMYFLSFGEKTKQTFKVIKE